MPPMDAPADFELIVMLAVLQLPGKAYGVSLRRKIEERTEGEVNYGSLYAALERLESRNWLRSVPGAATQDRDGYAKRLYYFTATGLRAFQTAGVQVQPLLDEYGCVEEAEQA